MTHLITLNNTGLENSHSYPKYKLRSKVTNDKPNFKPLCKTQTEGTNFQIVIFVILVQRFNYYFRSIINSF